MGPPEKKIMCLISWERMQKGTHINFFGGILGGPFSAAKVWFVVFPVLNFLRFLFLALEILLWAL